MNSLCCHVTHLKGLLLCKPQKRMADWLRRLAIVRQCECRYAIRVIRILILPLSIAAAALAQFLGYTGNCSEGSTDGWLAGAMTSLPFFGTILLLALASILLRGSKRPRLDKLAFGLVAAGCLALVLGNLVLLSTVFLHGENLCGAEFGAAGREDYTIAVVYGLVPLLVGMLALFAARRVRPFAEPGTE